MFLTTEQVADQIRFSREDTENDVARSMIGIETFLWMVGKDSLGNAMPVKSLVVIIDVKIPSDRTPENDYIIATLGLQIGSSGRYAIMPCVEAELSIRSESDRGVLHLVLKGEYETISELKAFRRSVSPSQYMN